MKTKLAEVSGITGNGAVQYGTATTYRFKEMRRSGGPVVALYETVPEMLLRLEQTGNWRCFAITYDNMDTWATAYLRRDV